MTEKTKGKLYEYLDTEMEIDLEFIEEDCDGIVTILEQESYIGKVKEFETTFVNLNDVKFDEEMLKKRINLMFEELSEIAIAGGTSVRTHFFNLMIEKSHECNNILTHEIKENVETPMNKVEVLDGLCDLQYVLSGSVIKLGLDSMFDEAFLAVHENNMDKKYDTYADVKKRANKWEKQNTELADTLFPEHRIEIIPDSGKVLQPGEECKYILKVDGKIIKPENHKKVSLLKFLPKDEPVA